ncbi:MAG TPA: cell division protein CrgA [Acidimicrobiales bacterium]|jgi:hypothetical protein|nr:cell division protein CrgA [Acidimicrobiales bacterium]
MSILRRGKSKEPDSSEKPAVTKHKASGRVTPKSTGRYTAPIPKEYRRSPTWVPVLMLTFLILGMLVIIMNYLPGAGVLPGDSNNWYLLLGLGLITMGFITATKYH